MRGTLKIKRANKNLGSYLISSLAAILRIHNLWDWKSPIWIVILSPEVEWHTGEGTNGSIDEGEELAQEIGQITVAESEILVLTETAGTSKADFKGLIWQNILPIKIVNVIFPLIPVDDREDRGDYREVRGEDGLLDDRVVLVEVGDFDLGPNVHDEDLAVGGVLVDGGFHFDVGCHGFEEVVVLHHHLERVSVASNAVTASGLAFFEL